MDGSIPILDSRAGDKGAGGWWRDCEKLPRTVVPVCRWSLTGPAGRRRGSSDSPPLPTHPFLATGPHCKAFMARRANIPGDLEPQTKRIARGLFQKSCAKLRFKVF
ncbi:hypothetical protein J6590_006969 [Homalodisca vitripennis]|nr:hypothetical protein J6590_006969 [Homalodisca vitripennis]